MDVRESHSLCRLKNPMLISIWLLAVRIITGIDRNGPP